MATYVYTIRSEVEADAALTATVTDARFAEALRGKPWRADGLAVRTDILDRDLVEEKKCSVLAFEPKIKMLRMMDTKKPVMGKIYFRLMSILQEIREVVAACDPAIFLHACGDQMMKSQERRNAYMFHRYMGAAYALDPEFIDVDLTLVDPEVMTALEETGERVGCSLHVCLSV